MLDDHKFSSSTKAQTRNDAYNLYSQKQSDGEKYVNTKNS